MQFFRVSGNRILNKIRAGGSFLLAISKENTWIYNYFKYKILNIFFDAPVVLCPSFGSMERLKLWRFIYGAHKQINGVLKARSQC